MPQKFDCSYVGEDNKLHRPVMIHRAIFGSVERFMAILIEHFAGEFPLWLSPIQAKIIPITESQVAYANDMKSKLEAAGLRVEVDYRSEKMGLKIREAEKQKIPYMLVIGDKEVENQSLALRKRKEGNIGVMNIQETIERFINEINHNR
jgi:threonyl-tRNA synthetase